MGTLIPRKMTNDEAIEFRFDFKDSGAPRVFFQYKSFDIGGVFTSNPFQKLQATVREGPFSLDDIPTRVTDAVLMTVSDVPVTVPVQDHRIRLILQGALVWEWDVHFEAPVSTFHLDGVWNKDETPPMLFPDAFPILLNPDFALGGALTAAMAETAVRFPSLGIPLRPAISVVAIDESTSPPTFKHAGMGEFGTHFSASLLKAAAMFAAFELRQSASEFALTAGDSTAADLFARMSASFDPAIENSVPLILSDPSIDRALRVPTYGTVFEGTQLASGGYLIKFQPSYASDLRGMIVDSLNDASERCIKALGYSWINGVLKKSGFFRSRTNQGIWLAGTFDEKQKTPVVRIPSLNDGPSAQAMTCFDMANLYALLFEKTIIDSRGIDSICDEMLQLLADSARGPDPSWMQTRAREKITGLSNSFTITHTKIGEGPLKSTERVASEATIVQHNPSGTKFIIVWQNVLNTLDSLNGVSFLVESTIKHFLGIP